MSVPTDCNVDLKIFTKTIKILGSLSGNLKQIWHMKTSIISLWQGGCPQIDWKKGYDRLIEVIP